MAWKRVAAAADVPAGEVRVFAVDGRSLAVANAGGDFYAIDDVCSHDGGPLGEGAVWGTQVECPRHGARFDLKTGRPTTLPAVVPVRTYPARLQGEDVEVDVD